MELVIEGRAFIDGELVPRMIGIENGKICSIKRSSLRGDEHIDLGDRAMIARSNRIPMSTSGNRGLLARRIFRRGPWPLFLGASRAPSTCRTSIPPVISLSALEEKKRSIEKRSWTDYGLFGGCVATLDVHAMGPEVIGFKLFLGSSTGRLLVTDRVEIEHIAAKVKATGKVLSVHAEDENHMRKMEEKDLNDHLKTRPVAAEVSAINGMTKFDGTRINICHISSKEGLQAAVSAGFTKEVTAHHLFLNKDCGKGAYAKTNPPIRTEEDRVALMAALQKGEFDMIGSDHAPHTIEEKEQDFESRPIGRPGGGNDHTYVAGPGQKRVGPSKDLCPHRVR